MKRQNSEKRKAYLRSAVHDDVGAPPKEGEKALA
jgi:hypothetical protein